MAITNQDRSDYERGQHDRNSSLFDRTVTDVAVQHPDSEAYYKGRNDEQLDGDKKSK